MPSSTSRLRSGLIDIIAKLADLIDGLPVRSFDNPGNFIGFPDYYWGETTPQQTNAQLEIKRDYETWFELFTAVFARAPNDVTRRIEEADNAMRKWIELETNHSISDDLVANENKMRDDAERFFGLLEILETEKPEPPIVVPDTNAFANEREPVKYASVAGEDTFEFLLLPTVMGELDVLKTSHRNPEFREKVTKAIKRVKGWRQQGPLVKGVTINRTIKIRAVAHEPDMENTLTWLTRESKDDRIIASVLEVQAENPAARLVLVTGDINLMNKADVAQIETAEWPRDAES